MAAVADFDFVRATFAGEMPPSQADTNAQLARVVGGRIGRRPPVATMPNQLSHHARSGEQPRLLILW